jgi:hypothetical protein
MVKEGKNSEQTSRAARSTRPSFIVHVEQTVNAGTGPFRLVGRVIFIHEKDFSLVNSRIQPAALRFPFARVESEVS